MKRAKKATAKQTSALAIVKAGKAPLSINQRAFNKLTARIEKLRSEIAKKQRQFDEALQLYSREVVPVESRLAQLSRQLLDIIFPFYQKRQPKNLRPVLKDMLRHHLQNVLQSLPGEPDEELKHLFQELEGERYDTVQKREEEMMRAEMENAFKNWGVHVKMDTAGMSEEEMAAKMAEAREQLKGKMAEEEKRLEERRKSRRKTVRQQEREQAQQAAEALKQKSMGTLYRQLAKLLHPDLEQNESRRAEKEVLMQEVTRAYEAKDLHALLLLELKWMQREQSYLEAIADEKLGLYLEILREQAGELEAEKWQLANHPRYRVLVDKLGYGSMTFPVKAVKDELHQMASFQRQCEQDIDMLQSPQALQHLKAMAEGWKEESDEDDDLLSYFMAMSERRR